MVDWSENGMDIPDLPAPLPSSSYHQVRQTRVLHWEGNGDLFLRGLLASRLLLSMRDRLAIAALSSYVLFPWLRSILRVQSGLIKGNCRSRRGCGGNGVRVLDHVCPATVKSMFTAFLGVVTTALARHSAATFRFGS